MMVSNKYALILAVASALCLCSCNREAKPVEYAEPEVEFTMTEDNISAVVGDPVVFSAKLVAGEKVSTIWYIDGIAESSSQTFTHIFSAPGIYSVRFEARNGSGCVSREYTVDVADAFEVRLSVGDSLQISRKQMSVLKVAAIVEKGSDITHSWTVDGEVLSDEVFFGSLRLDEFKDYNVEYYGYNSVGSYRHAFTVNVIERELEISFSVTDANISIFSGKYLTITANALFGATGLTHKWSVDGDEVSTEATLNWLAATPGYYTISYYGENAKGENVSREWNVHVEASGVVWSNFEGITSLESWWTLGQNQPGIELVENPLVYGINVSSQCLRNKVNGTGGTSGYFDITINQAMLDANPGLESKLATFKTLRFMVNMNGNDYCVFAQHNGKTQIAPVQQPTSKTQWCVVEFHFPDAFKKGDKFTIRGMRDASGASISGFNETTNNRTQYFDDFEFVD